MFFFDQKALVFLLPAYKLIGAQMN